VGWKRASSFGFSALAFSIGTNQMCLTERWLLFSLQVTVLSYTQAGIFTTKLSYKELNFKFTTFLSYEARNPCLRIGDVMPCFLYHSASNFIFHLYRLD
jgi:hypothetical protein